MRPARLVRRIVLQAGGVLVHRLEQFGAVTLEQRPPQPCRDIGSYVVGKELKKAMPSPFAQAAKAS